MLCLAIFVIATSTPLGFYFLAITVHPSTITRSQQRESADSGIPSLGAILLLQQCLRYNDVFTAVWQELKSHLKGGEGAFKSIEHTTASDEHIVLLQACAPYVAEVHTSLIWW